MTSAVNGGQAMRQLDVLRYLWGRAQPVSVVEIIDDLGIGERTAYRDLEQLIAH